jgi:hypothetical protein
MTTKTTTKVVYNCTYGGYTLPPECADFLQSHGQLIEADDGYIGETVWDAPRFNKTTGEWTETHTRYVAPERHNKFLVAWVESNPRRNPYASKLTEDEVPPSMLHDLKVIEIPGTKYWIREYDGAETVYAMDTMEWIDAAE